jgi:hypothetical protein
MNLRRKQPPDSLYMLLDTMSNAFGGIILLAVLVSLLTNKNVQQRRPADTQEMLHRRLAIAEAELQRSLELSTSLNAKAQDAGHKSQIALLAQRKQLQDTLQQARDEATSGTKELDSAMASDAAVRLEGLNAELARMQAQRLQLQNSKAATAENINRLNERIKGLQQQVANAINNSQRILRLPKERETDKRPFYIIVQYGRFYPCRRGDLTQNEDTIAWTSRGDSEIARPMASAGYGSSEAWKLRELLGRVPPDLFYIAFITFEDSFAEFNLAKNVAVAAHFTYGWEPFRNQDGPVAFGSSGHRPKPQ